MAAVGIHTLGDSTFNRNRKITQGSIVANTGERIEDIHPIMIEGRGHTSLSNVEAFSGPNGALSTLNQSQDFLFVGGDDKLTVSMFGCRMRNYRADTPITIQNAAAIVQAVACVEKQEDAFQHP